MYNGEEPDCDNNHWTTIIKNGCFHETEGSAVVDAKELIDNNRAEKILLKFVAPSSMVRNPVLHKFLKT